MIALTPEEIEYWNERADEPLGFERVIMTAEEKIEFDKNHPMPTKEEILDILRAVQA